MKKITKICSALSVLSILALTPKSSFAGDQEWAVAGKILTGIVAANFIGQAIDSSPSIEVSRVEYCKPRYSQRKAYRKYKRKYYKCNVRKRPYYKRSFSRKSRRISSRPSCKEEPIVVYIENGRRIYQPAIKGATAYLQVYSNLCNEWVTLEEYPSIW